MSVAVMRPTANGSRVFEYRFAGIVAARIDAYGGKSNQ